jgi:hypothetical protein
VGRITQTRELLVWIFQLHNIARVNVKKYYNSMFFDTRLNIKEGIVSLDVNTQHMLAKTNQCHGFKFSTMFSACGPSSSVGIATELQAGRSQIESRGRRDFPPVQTGPGAHQASCKMSTESFQGVKCGRGVLLTTHPLLVPQSWKSRGITTHPLGHTGPVTGSLHLLFHYEELNSLFYLLSLVG